jgi:hypothetical protein
MDDHYVSLRERLKQTAPDLAADLDQQWKIAIDEWLPAIEMSLDSSNGLAHIRNIENHLDTTLKALFQHNKTAGVFQMRPIELAYWQQGRPRKVVSKNWMSPSFAPPIGVQDHRFFYRGRPVLFRPF